MIRTGDTITNPVTGESVTFRRTSADSDGELVIAEVTLERRGSAAGVHMHPNQTETFRVVDGSVGFRIGGRRLTATSGQSVVVKPGIAHTFWNEGESQAAFVCEMRPALGFERLLETMFALARDGKTNRRGVPHPLRLAAIADHHRDDLLLPIVPRAVQRLAAKVGATAGWALAEFGPTYDGSPPCADFGGIRRAAIRPVGASGSRPAPATVRVVHPQRTA